MLLLFSWHDSPQWGRVSSSKFTITFGQTTHRTSLDKWSARRRNPYLTTHNAHKKQTSMPPAGFKLAIAVSEPSQTQALNDAAIGIGAHCYLYIHYKTMWRYFFSVQCSQKSEGAWLCLKVPTLHSLVLPIIVVLRWTWVWRIGGLILMRENQRTRRKT